MLKTGAMRVSLKPHPDLAGSAVTSIEVEVSRPRPALLQLEYLVSGAVADLLLPPPAPPLRRDELWRHTCFEAFIKSPDSGAYYELNFAPSTEWAAYSFDYYRAGMADLTGIDAPRIEPEIAADRYSLHVSLELEALHDRVAAWSVGLSAIVEEKNGRKSYWALAHPPGKADFHHADGFALQLPMASS